MVPKCFNSMKPLRRKMEIAADRIRDRLNFVVIKHAGQIAPAFVTAQFDQTGADHDAKAEPAKKPEHQNWWPTFWKRSPIDQRAEKNRQEAGFEQLNFPTVTVPNLADVNNRHIHRPKHSQQNCVRVTAENNQRQRESDPGEARHPLIGTTEPKERRPLQHPFRPRTELAMNVVNKIVR